MKVQVSSSGVSRMKTVIEGGVTVEGENLELRLSDLPKNVVGIRNVQIGIAADGDLYLLMEKEEEGSEVFRINTESIRRVSANPTQVLELKWEVA